MSRHETEVTVDDALEEVAAELRQDVHDLGNSLAHIKLGVSLLDEQIPKLQNHAQIVTAIHEAIDDADSIYRLMLARLKK